MKYIINEKITQWNTISEIDEDDKYESIKNDSDIEFYEIEDKETNKYITTIHNIKEVKEFLKKNDKENYHYYMKSEKAIHLVTRILKHFNIDTEYKVGYDKICNKCDIFLNKNTDVKYDKRIYNVKWLAVHDCGVDLYDEKDNILYEKQPFGTWCKDL